MGKRNKKDASFERQILAAECVQLAALIDAIWGAIDSTALDQDIEDGLGKGIIALQDLALNIMKVKL